MIDDDFADLDEGDAVMTFGADLDADEPSTASTDGGQQVLKEEWDPAYEPTEDEITEYASEVIQIDLGKYPQVKPLLRDGLKAPLPSEWKPVKDTESEDLYYFNFKTEESSWEHPCDVIYRDRVNEAIRKIDAGEDPQIGSSLSLDIKSGINEEEDLRRELVPDFKDITPKNTPSPDHVAEDDPGAYSDDFDEPSEGISAPDQTTDPISDEEEISEIVSEIIESDFDEAIDLGRAESPTEVPQKSVSPMVHATTSENTNIKADTGSSPATNIRSPLAAAAAFGATISAAVAAAGAGVDIEVNREDKGSQMRSKIDTDVEGQLDEYRKASAAKLEEKKKAVTLEYERKLALFEKQLEVQHNVAKDNAQQSTNEAISAYKSGQNEAIAAEKEKMQKQLNDTLAKLSAEAEKVREDTRAEVAEENDRHRKQLMAAAKAEAQESKAKFRDQLIAEMRSEIKCELAEQRSAETTAAEEQLMIEEAELNETRMARENRLKELRDVLIKLDKQIEEAESHLNDSRDRKSSINHEIKETAAVIEQLKSQVEADRYTVGELEKAAGNESIKKEQAEKEEAELKAAMEVELSKIKEELATELESRSRDLQYESSVELDATRKRIEAENSKQIEELEQDAASRLIEIRNKINRDVDLQVAESQNANEMVARIDKLEADLEKAGGKNEVLAANIAQYQQQAQAAETVSAQLTEANRILQAQLSDASSSIEQHNKELGAASSKNHAEFEKLSIKLSQTEKELSDANRTISECQDTIRNLSDEGQKDLQSREHVAAKCKVMKIEHEAELNAIKAKHANDIETVKLKHETELSELSVKMSVEMQEVVEAGQRSLNEAKAKHKAEMIQLATLQDDIKERAEVELSKIQHESEELLQRSSAALLDSEKNDLMDNRRKEMHNQVKDELDVYMSILNEQNEEEKKGMKAAMASELEAFSSILQEQLEDQKVAAERQCQIALQDYKANLTDGLNDQKHQLSETLNTSSTIELLEAAHTGELALLKERHQTILDRENSEHERNLANFRADLASEEADARSRAEEDHNQRLREVKEKYNEACSDAESHFAKEYGAVVAELRREHSEAINTLLLDLAKSESAEIARARKIIAENDAILTSGANSTVLTTNYKSPIRPQQSPHQAQSTPRRNRGNTEISPSNSVFEPIYSNPNVSAIHAVNSSHVQEREQEHQSLSAASDIEELKAIFADQLREHQAALERVEKELQEIKRGNEAYEGDSDHEDPGDDNNASSSKSNINSENIDKVSDGVSPSRAADDFEEYEGDHNNNNGHKNMPESSKADVIDSAPKVDQMDSTASLVNDARTNNRLSRYADDAVYARTDTVTDRLNRSRDLLLRADLVLDGSSRVVRDPRQNFERHGNYLSGYRDPTPLERSLSARRYISRTAGGAAARVRGNSMLENHAVWLHNFRTSLIVNDLML